MIDNASLIIKAEKLRRQLGEDQNSPLDIFALAQEIEKLTIVFYPMGTSLSGMCIKGTEGKCTIALNSTMTLGRQHFSLAHEFYHLFYDDNMLCVCSTEIGKGNDTERMADCFASYFLMPCAEFAQRVEGLMEKHGGKLDITDIIRIEQYFGVSHQAAVYQLNNCGYIDKEELEVLLHTSVKRKAEAMGFTTDLYSPLEENKQYRTYGHYIQQVEKLREMHIISDGKYEELLLDAFRDDIVYGEEEGDVID